MAEFKYRFKMILEQKKREEEQVLREMAPFVENLNRLEDRIRLFNQNLDDLNQNKVERIKSGDSLNHFVQLGSYYREIITQSVATRDLENEKLSPLRNKLRKIIARRQAFEIIRDKDLLAYKKAKKKEEQKELDELSAKKYSGFRQK